MSIHIAEHGPDFKNMIARLLKRGRMRKEYISRLLDDEGMAVYKQAFTAQSADPENNYEIFEQLGDVAANKFIVCYAYKRFPQLFCTEGVKVVARLKINYGSRQSFSQIAENLGFWPHISASEEERSIRKKDLLEDTMESFCGATEFLLDRRTKPGVGNQIVYDILVSIFDEVPMSLKYNDLYDAKTRLKELFDGFPKLGTWSFTHQESTSTIWRIPPGCRHRSKWIKLGQGTAVRKKDSEQKAAEAGLKALKKRGYTKEPPPEYKRFCGEL